MIPRPPCEICPVAVCKSFGAWTTINLCDGSCRIKKQEKPPAAPLTTSADEMDLIESDLLESSKALLELDAAGALVPHGIGGHARNCLTWAVKEITRLRSELNAAHSKGFEECRGAMEKEVRGLRLDNINISSVLERLHSLTPFHAGDGSEAGKSRFDAAQEQQAARSSTAALQPRLIDGDELWKLFVGHYWDSFDKDRDVILSHVESVIRHMMDRAASSIEPPPPVAHGNQGLRAEAVKPQPNPNPVSNIK